MKKIVSEEKQKEVLDYWLHNIENSTKTIMIKFNVHFCKPIL